MGGQLAAQEPTEPHGEGHHHGEEGEVGEDPDPGLGLAEEEQKDGKEVELERLVTVRKKEQKNTLEQMMREARTRKQEKTPSSRRKKNPEKNPGKKPGKKELVVEKEQQEKMMNLMKSWSDKAKAVKASEVVESRKEPLVKQLSLVETRKRRFSQVQEEVNSFEQWKRRKEEQRKHQNMTMGKVEEMQKEGVRDRVNRVVITD